MGRDTSVEIDNNPDCPEEDLSNELFNEMLSTPTGSTTEEEEEYDPGLMEEFDWTSVPEDDHDATRFDDLPEMDVIMHNISII